MPRARKLYLSEMLTRCKNKDLQIAIKTKDGYKYFINQDIIINNYKKYLDKQVIEYYISHTTYTKTLFIKI